jgi:hypothetical protein
MVFFSFQILQPLAVSANAANIDFMENPPLPPFTNAASLISDG